MIRMKEKFYTLQDFNLKPVLIRNLNIKTVYRTELAHNVYKGQTNFGRAIYTSLTKEEAKEYTLDPNSTTMVSYDSTLHGSIDSYSVLQTMRVVVFDLDEDNDFNKFRKIKDNVPNLREFFLNNNVHGLVIYAESMNYGGNQLVVYDTKFIR